MTTNEERAAEIIGQHVKCGWSICDRRRQEDGTLPPLDVCENTGPSCRDVAEGILYHLAAADLLAPEGMTVEWEAVVAWRNHAGQTEQTTGHGVTREDALADARGQDRWLTTATEVAHSCAHRHVTPWEAEDTTTEKEN